MIKIRKLILGLLLIILVCVAATCLSACKGCTKGIDGEDGKSAYEIWLDEGHTGSQADFLEWLKGSDGAGSTGENGQDGTDGKDGKSAYEIWLDEGHTGTEADFLEWLKGSDGTNGTNGTNGKSAYDIFMQQFPYYQGTEEQWLIALINGQLRLQTVTFKSEVADDIVKYVVGGYTLTDIPEVPEKEGQTSAAWNVTDFSNITADMTVNAVYDMRKYVTFHNGFTEDEDIVKVVNYNEALTDIPTITAKIYNDSKWSITDFSHIKTDLQVEAIYATQGLQFTAINQQTQYMVSQGEMNTQTEELYIPAEYSGKVVTVIDSEAFARTNIKIAYIPDSVIEIRDDAFTNCHSLTSVFISDSVTNIGSYAFSGCRNLTNVVIPDSVTSIGDCAFYYCDNLTSIVIPNSVTSIGIGAFGTCSGLTNIVIPNSVTSIGFAAFGDCSSLTSVVIPDGITSIEAHMFNGCNSLKSIVIPDSITNIEDYAFSDCRNLETIYFKGTATKFSQIVIMNRENEAFTDAMVYYYSETEPSDDGFYWHYDTDNVTPVIWEKEI